MFISNDNFEQINPNSENRIDAIDLLENMGCVREKFMNLDYLFIPFHDTSIGHYSLLGLAPKQKYASRDLNPLKRPRIFAELANARRDRDDIITGFVGKYAYNLLAIPPKPLHNSRDGIPLEDREEPEEPIIPLEEVAILQRNTGGPEDLYEARGMADGEQRSREPIENKSSLIREAEASAHGFSSDMAAAIEIALVTEFMQHLPERYAAWKAKTEYVRQSGLITRAFPPQFRAPNFRKAGFFYPRITIPDAEPDPPFTLLSKDREIAFAHRKRQNHIAACVETFWNDEVRPMDGMIRDFDTWLAENPRIGIGKIKGLLKRWMIGRKESPPLAKDEILLRSTFVQYIKLQMGRSLANLK
ncbi:hypothetical protein IFR05_014010 [Cadophora sp. M221]|nr:hypothetical protein IFR05_014010 [Cadophora sp. M221]